MDLGDYLTYRIGEPKQELTNAPKGGVATLARRSWSGRPTPSFTSTSVAATPWWASQVDRDDLLSFAGIGPATVLAIPKALQFSEKVHAYTFPWEGAAATRGRKTS